MVDTEYLVSEISRKKVYFLAQKKISQKVERKVEREISG